MALAPPRTHLVQPRLGQDSLLPVGEAKGLRLLVA